MFVWCRRLVILGADIQAKDYRGESPYARASKLRKQKGKFKVRDVMLESKLKAVGDFLKNCELFSVCMKETFDFEDGKLEKLEKVIKLMGDEGGKGRLNANMWWRRVKEGEGEAEGKREGEGEGEGGRLTVLDALSASQLKERESLKRKIELFGGVSGERLDLDMAEKERRHAKDVEETVVEGLGARKRVENEIDNELGNDLTTTAATATMGQKWEGGRYVGLPPGFRQDEGQGQNQGQSMDPNFDERLLKHWENPNMHEDPYYQTVLCKSCNSATGVQHTDCFSLRDRGLCYDAHSMSELKSPNINFYLNPNFDPVNSRFNGPPVTSLAEPIGYNLLPDAAVRSLEQIYGQPLIRKKPRIYRRLQKLNLAELEAVIRQINDDYARSKKIKHPEKFLIGIIDQFLTGNRRGCVDIYGERTTFKNNPVVPNFEEEGDLSGGGGDKREVHPLFRTRMCLGNCFLRTCQFAHSEVDLRPFPGNLAVIDKQKSKLDWMCDSCNFHNFARNQDCKNCRAAKGYTENLGAMTMYGPSENGNSNSNNISSIYKLENRPGDWECGRCFEHNFADRLECYIRTCRSPREMGKLIVVEIGKKRARAEAFPTPAPEMVNLKLQWTGREGICRNARERKKMDVCQWWKGGRKCKFGFNCRNRHEQRPSGKSGVFLGLVTEGLTNSPTFLSTNSTRFIAGMGVLRRSKQNGGGRKCSEFARGDRKWLRSIHVFVNVELKQR